MAGNEAGGRNEPLPLLDEDWRQLRVMRSHLAHSAVFQEARRCCTPENIEQNAQDHADEMEVLGSIYGEDMIRIPDLSRGTRQSAQRPSAASGESSSGQADDQPSSSEGHSLQEAPRGLPIFLVLVHVTLDGSIDIRACADASLGEGSSAPGSSSRECGGAASDITYSNESSSSNGNDSDGAKPPANADNAIPTTGGLPSSKSQKSITVSHLPPLRLLVVLPSTYPSSSPPLFSLLCSWLPPPLLSALASHLHSLWAEQQGTPVVYTWAAWLASEGLQHLGMERTITLSPLETATAGKEEERRRRMTSSGKGKGPALLDEQPGEEIALEESRAGLDAGCREAASEGGTVVGEEEEACSCSFVCSLLDPQADASLSLLAQYNRQRERQRFNAALHECGICLRELPGVDFLVSPLCSHFFCKPCSKQFANALVAEGNLGGLKCPDTSCRAAMPYEFLRSLLELEVFQRWEALTLQRALDSMQDVVYCPRCQDAVVEEASEHFAHCGRCSFSFCSLCLSAWHRKTACVSPELRLKLLKARKQGKEASEELLRKERDLEQQVQSLKLVETSSEPCPVCNMAIQKSEGCNKMTCSNCYSYFCYRCKRAITGYDHYRDGNCVLFDEEEIQAWERRMAQEQWGPQGGAWEEGGHDMGFGGWRDPHDQGGHRPEGPHGPARRCPRCRQVNAKDRNNNDMHCFACRTRFCGHCGAKDFKGQDHFGKNRCTQHTPW